MKNPCPCLGCRHEWIVIDKTVLNITGEEMDKMLSNSDEEIISLVKAGAFSGFVMLIVACKKCGKLVCYRNV